MIKKAKTSLTVLSQCLIKQYTESIDFVVSYDKIKFEERELTMSIFVISVFNIHFQFRFVCMNKFASSLVQIVCVPQIDPIF